MLYKGAFLLVTNKKENNIDSNLNKKLSGKMLARFLLYYIRKEKKRKGSQSHEYPSQQCRQHLVEV